MADTPKTATPPALGGARPLSECFLLAQYEGAEALPASDATGESVRKMKLSAVRAVAPFLKEWVGAMAIRAVEQDTEERTELYGPLGFALHIPEGSYKGWDGVREQFLRRLQCTQGHAVAPDALLPAITRLGLRYVDIWTGADFGEIATHVYWPVEQGTGTPVYRSEALESSNHGGVVSIVRVERALMVDSAEDASNERPAAAPPEIAAHLVIQVELDFGKSDAVNTRSLVEVGSVLDAIHKTSKLVAWRCMTPEARARSGVFDSFEFSEFDRGDRGTGGEESDAD